VEEDFEWVTDKLVQLANRCCEGRVVSVLEGGYQLGGEYCSAFAQSAKVFMRRGAACSTEPTPAPRFQSSKRRIRFLCYRHTYAL
jgi:acetoin utilization deacetylase AcuC-like enzyme